MGDREEASMKTFTFDNDLYVVRVLRGLEPIHSPIDDEALISAHIGLVDIYKSIKFENIDRYRTKGTAEETSLYEALQKIMGTTSFEYTAEVATCAFNANLGITSRNIASILSERLIYTRSGLYEYQVEQEAEKYFADGELITRSKIDEFSEYILSLRQGKWVNGVFVKEADLHD